MGKGYKINELDNMDIEDIWYVLDLITSKEDEVTQVGKACYIDDINGMC